PTPKPPFPLPRTKFTYTITATTTTVILPCLLRTVHRTASRQTTPQQMIRALVLAAALIIHPATTAPERLG
ncbi:hypothetical protein F5Y11DRAFT_365905, partial [Daldinia sp. FL1419]